MIMKYIVSNLPSLKQSIAYMFAWVIALFIYFPKMTYNDDVQSEEIKFANETHDNA